MGVGGSGMSRKNRVVVRDLLLLLGWLRLEAGWECRWVQVLLLVLMCEWVLLVIRPGGKPAHRGSDDGNLAVVDVVVVDDVVLTVNKVLL